MVHLLNVIAKWYIIILNDYFGSVFTVENTESIPSLGDRCSDHRLATVTIEIEDVWNQLVQASLVVLMVAIRMFSERLKKELLLLCI